MDCNVWPLLQCGWVGLGFIAFGVVVFLVLARIALQLKEHEE